jgi:hypothetical protein
MPLSKFTTCQTDNWPTLKTESAILIYQDVQDTAKESCRIGWAFLLLPVCGNL